MKKQRVLRGMVFLLILASMVLTTAIPQINVLAQEDVVRLTINNTSERDIWYKLNGPAYYYLYVKAGETKSYTPQRGVYDYTLYACGTFVKGELDLTNQKVINVPECGMKSHYGPQDQENIEDAGKMLNLVNVTFQNDTGRYMLLILEGPSVFVFQFNADQDKEYTIPMGYYTYTMYGCGSTYHGTLYARYHKEKEFTCP